MVDITCFFVFFAIIYTHMHVKFNIQYKVQNKWLCTIAQWI